MQKYEQIYAEFVKNFTNESVQVGEKVCLISLIYLIQKYFRMRKHHQACPIKRRHHHLDGMPFTYGRTQNLEEGNDWSIGQHCFSHLLLI